MNIRVDDGIPAPENIAEDFHRGNFDYLPDKVRWPLAQLLLKDLVVRYLPGDEFLPTMAEAAVADLANRNLDSLTSSRSGILGTYLELFTPIEIKTGVIVVQELGLISLKPAMVVLSHNLSGKIDGPNRQMLELVYRRLGLANEPDLVDDMLDSSHPIVHSLPTQSTPTTQQNRRRRIPLKKSRNISFKFRRAYLNEIEFGFADGQIFSVVNLEK